MRACVCSYVCTNKSQLTCTLELAALDVNVDAFALQKAAKGKKPAENGDAKAEVCKANIFIYTLYLLKFFIGLCLSTINIYSKSYTQ